MNIRKPERTILRARRETTLAYYEKETKELYVRGGVCWPFAEYQGESVAIRGYAVLLGQDIEDQTIYVLEGSEPAIMPPSKKRL